MRIKTSRLEEPEGTSVVRVEGVIDSVNVTDFFQTLNRLFKEGTKNLVIDLSEATYLSSGALSVIADAYRRAEGCGGKVLLSGVSERLMELFGVVQFDRLLEFYPDSAAALDMLISSEISDR